MPFRSLTSTLSAFTRTMESQPLELGRPAYAHHNWKDEFRVSTSYEVETLASTFGNREQYTALDLRPLRSANLSAISDELKSGFLEQFLARTSPGVSATLANAYDFFGFGLGKSWKLPLDCDSTEIVNITATYIVVEGLDTRRFFEGQGVFLVPPYSTPLLRLNGTIELPALYAVIQPGSMPAGDPNRLILTPDPQGFQTDVDPPLALGWRVVPVMDCLPLLEVPSSYTTAKVIEAQISGEEYPGINVMPSSQPAGTTPPGYSTFTGQSGTARLVFPVDHNWAEALKVSYVRPGNSGAGSLTRMSGFRPRWSMEVTSLTVTRQEWYSILQAFDSTQGGARPMWVVSPTVIYEKAQRASSSRLVVPIGGNLQDFLNTTTATAFQYDGDWYVNEISAGTPVVGGAGRVTAWNLDMHETVFQIPGTLFTPCLHRAFAGRFSGALEEKWVTRDICEVSFTLVECEDKVPEELT